MGATFAVFKTWAAEETLTASDINALQQYILDNFTPSGVDDYSASTSQMQTVTTPGAVGTESLATSLAGEIERLRYMLKAITGEAQWYSAPDSTISELKTTIDAVQYLPANRIVSGAKRSGSNQSLFLDANGAAASVVIDASPTALALYINGVAVTQSADITISGLSLAPSSNNTALVNNARYADQTWTRWIGENDWDLTVDAMGSEISALVGKWAAFKIFDGVNTEYFLAYVKSSTALSHIRRGWYFDSTGVPVKRIKFADNDTITLMKLSWIFLKSDGTAAVTYTNPVYSVTQPSSPSVGDYWFDQVNETWKVHNGASFVSSSAILVGTCIQDTANCVAARSVDFYAVYDATNTIKPEMLSVTQMGSKSGGLISVAGNFFEYRNTDPKWSMTANLAGSEDMYDATEQVSTYYFAYITETGEVKISDMYPYYREDMLGFYHPYNPWRCVGETYNSAGSDLEWGQGIHEKSEALAYTPGGFGATGTKIRYFGVSSFKGTGLVYVSNSTFGDFIIATRPMGVTAGVSEVSTTSCRPGISVNATSLTTNIQSLTRANGAKTTYNHVAGSTDNSIGGLSFEALGGDFIRHHSDGASNTNSSELQYLHVVEMGARR